MSHSTHSGGVRRRARSRTQRRQRAARAARFGAASREDRSRWPRAAGDRAPDRHLWQRQLHPSQQRLDLGEFVNGHRREILFLQHLARRKRERRVEIGLVLDGFAAWRRRRQHRLREAGGELVGNAAAALYTWATLRRASFRAGADCARRGRTPARTARDARAWTRRTAASASRKSSRLSMPTASTAASASSTLAGPTGRPAARSIADEVDDVVGEASARHRTEQRRKRRRGRGASPRFRAVGFRRAGASACHPCVKPLRTVPRAPASPRRRA